MKKILELTVEKNKSYNEPHFVVYTDAGLEAVNKVTALNDLYSRNAELKFLINKLTEKVNSQKNQIQALNTRIDSLQHQINVILGVEEEGDTNEQEEENNL